MTATGVPVGEKGHRMSKQIILTANAPAPVGPYSQAVRSGDLLFCAGQIPLTKDGRLIEGDVTAQTEQVFTNIQAVLAAAGLNLEHVIKTTVFLKSMEDFQAMNAVYARYFAADTAPARSAVEVARLPKDVLVEIEVIAHT